MPAKGIVSVGPGSTGTLGVLQGAAAKNLRSALIDPETEARLSYHIGVNDVFYDVSGEILSKDDPRALKSPETFGLFCPIAYAMTPLQIRRLDQRNDNGNWTAWVPPYERVIEEMNIEIDRENEGKPEAEKKPHVSLETLTVMDMLRKGVSGEMAIFAGNEAYKKELRRAREENDKDKIRVLEGMKSQILWAWVPGYDKELRQANDDEIAKFEKDNRPFKNADGYLVKQNHIGEIVVIEKPGEISKMLREQAKVKAANDKRRAIASASTNGAFGVDIDTKMRAALENHPAFRRMLDQVDKMNEQGRQPGKRDRRGSGGSKPADKADKGNLNRNGNGSKGNKRGDNSGGSKPAGKGKGDTKPKKKADKEINLDALRLAMVRGDKFNGRNPDDVVDELRQAGKLDAKWYEKTIEMLQAKNVAKAS